VEPGGYAGIVVRIAEALIHTQVDTKLMSKPQLPPTLLPKQAVSAYRLQGPMQLATEQPGPSWATTNEAREIDVQFLLGHIALAIVRRCLACYKAERVAGAPATRSPGHWFELLSM